MMLVDGTVARIPIMATADMIRRSWARYQQRRADKKAKREQVIAENHGRLNPALKLDEVNLSLGAIEIIPSNNFSNELDARFFNNPLGVGCSKDFETPSTPATKGSSSPCSTPKMASRPESVTTVEDDDPLSVPKEEPQPFGHYDGPELFCWRSREKRKGRASEDDEPEDIKAQRKGYNKLLRDERQQELLRRGKVFLLKKVPSWRS